MDDPIRAVFVDRLLSGTSQTAYRHGVKPPFSFRCLGELVNQVAFQAEDQIVESSLPEPKVC
jgi:hypothetical protein